VIKHPPVCGLEIWLIDGEKHIITHDISLSSDIQEEIMFRRVIGILMLVLGLVGLVVSIAGVFYGRQLVDDSFGGIDNSLVLTTDSLDTAVESLELAKATIGDVNSGLDTVEGAAINIARTITDTRPLIDQVAVVVSEDAPASIEAMQLAVPAIAQVAGAIDQALVTLNGFSIDENILGNEIHYDLGIDYNPPAPFDVTFVALGDSMDGLPENLRSTREMLPALTWRQLATASLTFRKIWRPLTSRWLRFRVSLTSILLLPTSSTALLRRSVPRLCSSKKWPRTSSPLS
jgi:hypothetical protein